jgi:23S rRNA (adenine2503-C2)-methyltransferase
MGSGEPLDNYDNVLQFLRNLSDEKGINISPRNVSLSTSGIVPKMYDLANENLPINLTVSLHSPFDEHRKKIMPIAKAYSISEILKACDNYFEKTGRRFIFEYSLVKGVNDTDECINELIRLLKHRPCHVNIIRLNEVKENNLKATDDKNAYKFCDKLVKGGLSATVRRLNGVDIEGACGQLRRTFLKDNEIL